MSRLWWWMASIRESTWAVPVFMGVWVVVMVLTIFAGNDPRLF